MRAVTITEIQPLLPLALSFTACFHCVGRCRARVQRRLGPYHKCYFTLLFHINIAIDDINVKGG